MRIYSFLLGPQARSEQCLLQELKVYPELKVFRYQVLLVRWFRLLELSGPLVPHLHQLHLQLIRLDEYSRPSL
jgi:hypothetical protein